MMSRCAARTDYPRALAAVRPVVWSIAGSDCSGGAGLQADLKTFHDLGVHGCTVVTALTAQNSIELASVESVSPQMLRAQLSALEQDFAPAAIKIGMLGHPETWPTLQECMQRVGAFVVHDPVMQASTGGSMLSEQHIEALRSAMLPGVGLLTPNRSECERLSGIPIPSADAVPRAARALRDAGCRHVLVTGGHFDGRDVLDYYEGPACSFWLCSPRWNTAHTHGTGCTLSAAIAAFIARGFDLPDALVLAKGYLNKALRNAYGAGQGSGPVAQSGWPDHPDLLPRLYAARPHAEAEAFPAAEPRHFGLYPIVDSLEQLQRLLPLGLGMIQLRAKQISGSELDRVVESAVHAAAPYDCRLYINDAWQAALRYGAYGVHLGQDDLAAADLSALRRAGLRLGISTHSCAEIAHAAAYRPSYIAIGTVFRTATKTMDYEALSLDGFRLLRNLTPGPVVAIGGIHLPQAADLYAAGADGVAVISELRDAPDPADLIRRWAALKCPTRQPMASVTGAKGWRSC